MTTSNIGFHEVAELAAHLSPEEQIRLVAWIGAGLNTTASSPGAASAVLCAMREPPHLSPGDVDELERTIAAGKLPLQQEGVFDGEDAR